MDAAQVDRRLAQTHLSGVVGFPGLHLSESTLAANMLTHRNTGEPTPLRFSRPSWKKTWYDYKVVRNHEYSIRHIESVRGMITTKLSSLIDQALEQLASEASALRTAWENDPETLLRLEECCAARMAYMDAVDSSEFYQCPHSSRQAVYLALEGWMTEVLAGRSKEYRRRHWSALVGTFLSRSSSDVGDAVKATFPLLERIEGFLAVNIGTPPSHLVILWSRGNALECSWSHAIGDLFPTLRSEGGRMLVQVPRVVESFLDDNGSIVHESLRVDHLDPALVETLTALWSTSGSFSTLENALAAAQAVLTSA